MNITKGERIDSVLQHMRKYAELAVSFAQHVDAFEAFCADELIRMGIAMAIINLGELTKQLPGDYRDAHSEIPWRAIAGMRDLAAHRYQELSDKIVWRTVQESIPELLRFIEEQLS